MSYPYRVVIKRAVSASVRAGDKATTKLNPTKILGKESMMGKMTETLEKRGWEKNEDGTYSKTGDKGIKRTIDPEKMEVTDELELEETIEREEQVQVRSRKLSEHMTREERQALQKEAEGKFEKEKSISDAEKDNKRAEIEKQVEAVLSETESDRTRELNAILMETYAECLKEKANTLGKVTGIHEETRAGGAEYEMVIKIEA